MVGRSRKGDPWRHLTVTGHISAPVTSQSELAQQRTRRVSSPQKRRRIEAPRIEAPVTTQSELYQQRTLTRRRNRQVSLAQNEDFSNTASTQFDTFQRPAQTLIDAYLRRKAATSRFPLKTTAEDLWTAMRRYEHVIKDACSTVEISCASCGEFMAKAGPGLIPVGDERLRSMTSPEGTVQLDNCGMVNGAYQVCQTCLNAFNGGRIPKFSALNAVTLRCVKTILQSWKTSP